MLDGMGKPRTDGQKFKFLISWCFAGAVVITSDSSATSNGEQVPYDSLFEGGGAFRVNQAK